MLEKLKQLTKQSDILMAVVVGGHPDDDDPARPAGAHGSLSGDQHHAFPGGAADYIVYHEAAGILGLSLHSPGADPLSALAEHRHHATDSHQRTRWSAGGRQRHYVLRAVSLWAEITSSA